MKVKKAQKPAINATGSVIAAVAVAALDNGLDLTLRELYVLATLTQAQDLLERMSPQGDLGDAYTYLGVANRGVVQVKHLRSTFETLAAKGLVKVKKAERSLFAKGESHMPFTAQLTKEAVEFLSDAAGGVLFTMPELDREDVRESLWECMTPSPVDKVAKASLEIKMDRAGVVLADDPRTAGQLKPKLGPNKMGKVIKTMAPITKAEPKAAPKGKAKVVKSLL